MITGPKQFLRRAILRILEAGPADPCAKAYGELATDLQRLQKQKRHGGNRGANQFSNGYRPGERHPTTEGQQT